MLLVEFIKNHKDNILRQWETFAEQIAGSLPRWILRDHAAAIIELIAQQMANSSPPTRQLSSTAAAVGDPIEYLVAAHVKLRIDSGFDLAQIVSEYCTLRACAIGLWREHDEGGFNAGAAEISRFAELVDEHITAAVSFYKEQESNYRDRFLGILGHDLRNPINAIVLAAARLAEQGLDEQQLKTLAVMQNSTRRLIGMVNDVLDFARGRLGSPMPITMGTANLGLIAREVIDEVQAANPGYLIDFQTDGDLSGHWDIDRLKQALTNLLINAIQHGSGDHVTLTAKSDNTFVVLEVHNRGPAIPAELLPTMFDPLVRGSSHNRDENGLGLGLFIVDQIISAHKGTIAVTSSEDSGTTFVVRLPRQ
ncbi:MAG: sensor histidine kinase [Deltaproteobacteria bacterium]|nr:sensor histidine kinase [Deltaproteobacteria bacterium]